jgi:hypothetical protein
MGNFLSMKKPSESRFFLILKKKFLGKIAKRFPAGNVQKEDLFLLKKIMFFVNRFYLDLI